MRLVNALVLVLVCTSFVAQGQNKALKKGNKKYENGEYNVAIALYQRHTSKPALKAESNFRIAESYRLSHRLKEAAPYYDQAIRSGYRKDNVYLFYAQSLKSLGNYEKARTELNNFLRNAGDDAMAEMARHELENLDALEALMAKETFYRVKNLDIINSDKAEYSPVYNDGNLYFTSNRDGGKTYKATGTSFTNIYKAKTKGARVDTTTISHLGDVINSANINEGTVTFTPDGKTMVFARGNTGKRKGTQDVNLYISRYRNQDWGEPRMLSISERETWDSSPTFSRDGRTLYFASYNRKDGLGGVDLYSTRMDRRGRFSAPKNLGDEINTPGDEMFPYISNDGHMYFSSDGHPGFGGLDLFVAKRTNGRTFIENLGKPVNTTADDFGIFLFGPDRGFFSSNREGGHGDDDIYTFVNDDPNLKSVNYFLEGITMTHDKADNAIILSDVNVRLLDYQGNLMDEITTDKDGKFNFRVYEQEHYTLIGEKQGPEHDSFFVTRQPYTTIGKSVPQEELVELVTNITLDTLLFLEPIIIDKSIVLENIYYEFARWDITPEAGQELDKLVNILIDNPEISIELSSHTDSVDTDSYNMRLSQRRAQSAVDYILEASGIGEDRIVARGYGETTPIARNTNMDGTDNVEGRAKNRRTEFKVLSINQEEQEGPDEERFFEEGDVIENTPKKKKNNN